MGKERQLEEEPTAESKKMCEEGRRANSALKDSSSKDNEVLKGFGGFHAPASHSTFNFGSQPAGASHSAFNFGRQPVAAQPSFNSESFGAGFKAGFESGFESGLKAASNGGLFVGNNQAKPSGFTFGCPSTTASFGLNHQAKPTLGFGLPSTTASFGGNNQAKPSAFNFGLTSTSFGGKPATQVVHISCQGSAFTDHNLNAQVFGFGGTSTASKLDSLMAGFHSEAALGMPLKDFSQSAVALLMFNYKVEDEKILRTTALAM